MSRIVLLHIYTPEHRHPFCEKIISAVIDAQRNISVCFLAFYIVYYQEPQSKNTKNKRYALDA